MNFDKDYKEFIEHLEKTCVLRPMKLDKIEDVAVRLFVTYLNIRYANPNPKLRCHVCKVKVGEKHLPVCSVGNDVFHP